jgi:hypothetical protein
MRTLAARHPSAILPSVLFWDVDPSSWLLFCVLCIQVCSSNIALEFEIKADPVPVSPALTIRALHKKYTELNEFLSSNNTVNKNQYLRVLIIATLGSVCLVPLGIYFLTISSLAVYPWPGWKKIHSKFSLIPLIPNSIWRTNSWQYDLEIVRWEFVFNAFAIFACFGIHKEARRSYLSAAGCVSRRVSCFWVKEYFISLIISVQVS